MEVFNPKKFSAAYQQVNGLTTKPLPLFTSNAQNGVQNMSGACVDRRTFSDYPCMTQRHPRAARNPNTDRLHQPVFLKLQENGRADVAVISEQVEN